MTSEQDFRELLGAVIAELGLKISEFQKEQLLLYIDLLLEGLEKQRLVGERSGTPLIEKHLFDSLYPLKLWRILPGSLLDLGTGAGLPGIPLKICLPEQKLYLLDANWRKINYLRRVGTELKLREVFYLQGRAEEWGRDPGCRERFDCVVSRAVARAAVLSELGLPLVRIGGYLLLYKGKQGMAEMEEAGASLRLCGGRLEKCWRYRLLTGEERTLYLIKKITPTPAAYPRRAGRPARKPLGD
jgi:16S rRNA (guanine527-N7)-methyltransferase